MSSPHSTVAALEYEERCPPFYRRRRFRQILYFLAACTLLGVGWHATPDIRDLRRAYWYHRCSGYTAPAGQPVYDDDPQTLPALSKDPAYEIISPGSGNRFARRHNDVWQGLASSFGSPLTAPAAFVHARTTSPGGWERLVVIQFGAFHKPALRHVAFVASLYAESDAGVGVRRVATQTSELHLLCRTTDRVRILDGRPDPKDPSRFTIDVQINGVAHTIDGQLGDGEIVTLTPRASPHANTMNVVSWRPTGVPLPQGFTPWPQPATRPTSASSADEPSGDAVVK